MRKKWIVISLVFLLIILLVVAFGEVGGVLFGASTYRTRCDIIIGNYWLLTPKITNAQCTSYQSFWSIWDQFEMIDEALYDRGKIVMQVQGKEKSVRYAAKETRWASPLTPGYTKVSVSIGGLEPESTVIRLDNYNKDNEFIETYIVQHVIGG